ncbi:peptidoglycan-binding protein [Pseudanabaena sp. FACHB-1998]|uniref:peptidoglycan-binding domain-containing protein n=1 Tax=Pseudanabaena sp. FACHB-1998 TaxID=2692858 RepID=UPI0016801F71|nr:peptidoglycan-binding protein [Pseudanabaena sp. FACHB-1998]MBD2176741.1 peptidoglycan-binding protein [Pseudanabaena sp. FACHB-1998]
MELLAYIQEELVHAGEAIAPDSEVSSTTINSSFQAWLQGLMTKSVKLSFNFILAGTTILVGLGSTLTAIAAVTPSQNVKYVQSLLAKNGFDPGAIDGVAGASTKNAILRAQKTYGLNTDGIAGGQTIAALENGGTSSLEIKDKTALKETAPASSTVMNLQKLLADRGFYNGAVDGIMGNQTRAAIIAAQKAYNLVPDGIAGSQTLAALESDGKATIKPISDTSTTSSTSPTTRSPEVANLQELLSKRGFYNGAIDGIKGDQTKNAILAAQKQYGLATDGIAGAQTLAALESDGSKVNIATRNSETTRKTTDKAEANRTEAKTSDKDLVTLQQLLAKRGFYNGAIDGVKGAQTNNAIIAAQKFYGLTSDGIAGAQTLAALQSDTKVSSSTPKPSTSAKTPDKAVNDDGVANLQNLLADRGFYNGPVTGFLGPRTKEAIMVAQKAYGLKADGIAGAQTIAALESGAPRQSIATKNSTPTVRVEPKPQTPAAPPQPELQPQIRVQPQAAPTPQPQATTPPAQPQATAQPKPTPQATATPQATVTPATPAPAATPAQPQASASDAQVLELQRLLAKRGFYNGKTDGALTGETRNAIIRAQNFYTINPADGSPSNKLIDSLSKDTFISEGN